MIRGSSSPRSSQEEQLLWMEGWGKFPSSPCHPPFPPPHLALSFHSFQAPVHPLSSLYSNLPTLSLKLSTAMSRQAVLCGRQSFYSPLPPGSVCFLKVMIHWKNQSLKHAKIMIWSAFLCALEVSDYIGHAWVFPCLCAALLSVD